MGCKSRLSLLLFFIVSIISTYGEEQELEPNCTNRWIHIRRLPRRFNLDLLKNCSQYHLFDNFCPYLANHGLGRKTHNRTQSWYRSDPLLLELIFHRRMIEYPCLTLDPNLANAIYLPYYTAIDALRYLYGPDVNSKAHGMELYDFLREKDADIWNRYNGIDHFVVISRPAWDFSQSLEADPPIWGTSFLELPQFYNITALIVEGRAWPWQEQAVPYLTSFHPPNLELLDSWINRVKSSPRTTLMLFAGGGGVGATPNIRRSIRNECENSTISMGDRSFSAHLGSFDYLKICDFVECSNGVCEHDPARYMKPMLHATFCLQPPGDTPTRRSTFDAIIAGCIPVFFEEKSARSQYSWHLPDEMYSEFAVLIPKEEVIFKGLRILDVLMSIPLARVREMREKTAELIPRVMYRKHGSAANLRAIKDAFDIAVEGALQKIEFRLKHGISNLL